MAIPIVDKDTTEYIEGGETRTIRSTVSEKGARRMMTMLVETYSETNLSVVREYIANAVDATVTAGSNVPVEVTVPTVLTPNIVVTDRGTGMSLDDLSTAFLSFAESTKENSNDVIGNLGIGAKSALMICDSFVVDTIKNGLRNVVRVSKSLDHEVLVENIASDSPNGTTVIIPVDYDAAQWSALIRKVAQFHRQGIVHVDGEEVESIHDAVSWIGPVRLKPVDIDAQWEKTLIVSGGTMFEVPSSLDAKIRNYVELRRAHMTIHLPVGAFEYTPSREHVIPSEVTEKAVFTALDEFNKEYVKLSNKLNTMAKRNPAKAIRERAMIVGESTSASILELKTSVSMGGDTTLLKKTRHSTRSRGSVWQVWEHNESLNTRTPLGAFHNVLNRTVVVTDVPVDAALPSVGRYMDTMPDKSGLIVMREGETHLSFPLFPDKNSTVSNGEFTVSPKKEGITTVTFKELKAELKRLNAKAKSRRGKAPELTYHVLLVDDPAKADKNFGNQLTLTQVAEFLATDSRRVALMVEENTYSARQALAQSPAGGAVIVLNKRLPSPVQKRIPSVQFAYDYIKEITAERLKGSDDKDIIAATVLNSIGLKDSFTMAHSVFNKSKEDAVDHIHPVIAEMAEVWERAIAAKHDSSHKVNSIKSVIASGSSPKSDIPHNMERSLHNAYPLLRGLWGIGKADYDHIIEYMLRVPPVLNS